jgi:glycosyltransferase 2 family protein
VTRRLAVLTSLPVRVAVTVALLAAFALLIDWGDFVHRLAEGDWRLFAVAVLVVFAALVIGALRWHVFLQAGQIRTTVPQTLRAYGIGMFANNFLPTGFGGDAARVLVIARAAPSTGRAIASVIVDRVTALACLVLLAWLAAAVARDEIPRSLLGTLAIATAAGVVTAFVFAFVTRSGRLRRLKEEARSTIGGAERARSVLLVTTALGLLYQLAMVLAAWILARSIDLNLSFALLAVVTPLVIIATLFPISIAGFGIREGSYIALLAEVGVSASDAALLSLLNVAALAIATLPGAFALLLSGDRRARVILE